MIKRERAIYSSETALMPFSNPSAQGPLGRVMFCSVDTMFHLMLRASPLPQDDDFTGIARLVHEAVRAHNGNHPGVAREIRPGGRQFKQKECLLSVWFPGQIDLEDMVCIVDSIPELDSGWLRSAVDQLKEEAGLASEDLPFLNRYFNDNSSQYRFSEDSKTGAWFTHGWFSAKGGTAYFEPATPAQVLESVAQCLQDAASTTWGQQKNRDGVECVSLRVIWNQPRGGVHKSFNEIHSRFLSIPGVYEELPAPVLQR